jgi:Ca2+/H+ antiporter, TMEM165/GDT1 family
MKWVSEWFDAFVSSLSMIFLSEIGDKTFLIAAVMSMRHTRITIFLASFSALCLMTIISVLLGAFIFKLIPILYAKIISTVLFFVFAIVMLKDAIEMTRSISTIQIHEVLPESESQRDSASTVALDLENAKNQPYLEPESSESVSSVASSCTRRERSPLFNREASNRPSRKFILKEIFSHVFLQTFTLILLAELGDRSQIATITFAITKVCLFHS